MEHPPFEVHKELDGWTLFWAQLEPLVGADNALAELRSAVVRERRAAWTLETLSAQPAVAALRKLFKAAGCDPSRYRPSSEALLRRILKGEDLPAIHPLVDLNNCLSAQLAVPCCVMTVGTFDPPMRFRTGRPGESYESLRGGVFELDGKPLLLDAHGPLDAPITGSQRVKVTAATESALLVAYLPEGVVAPEFADATLRGLLQSAPIADCRSTAAS